MIVLFQQEAKGRYRTLKNWKLERGVYARGGPVSLKGCAWQNVEIFHNQRRTFKWMELKPHSLVLTSFSFPSALTNTLFPTFLPVPAPLGSIPELPAPDLTIARLKMEFKEMEPTAHVTNIPYSLFSRWYLSCDKKEWPENKTVFCWFRYQRMHWRKTRLWCKCWV